MQLGEAWLGQDNEASTRSGECLDNTEGVRERAVLTFQCAGEDADRAEGALPLSWPLEAIHKWSLGGQRRGSAWLL